MNSEQFKQWCQRFEQPTSAKTYRKPLIMAVLNRTPDSFSDGGQYSFLKQALIRARTMIAEGADLIDIGGESSRPGAQTISVDEELERVIPLIEQLSAESDICISIDTTKAEVMQAAVTAGASMINDIRALENNKALVTAADLDVPVCLMHMRGLPATMQDHPSYSQDLVDEINEFFHVRIEACLTAGIKREYLIIDPGFGFGKTDKHNLYLLNQLAKFKQHHLPILIAVSRKSTLGTLIHKPVEQRLNAGLAVVAYAALQGVAMIRTHDVEETNQVLITLNAINQAC